MNVLPLPPRPSLDQYQKRAKELSASARSDDPAAIRAWAGDWLAALARAHGATISAPLQQHLDQMGAEIEGQVLRQSQSAKGESFTLAAAQFLIAGLHGFANWAEFAGHLERLATDSRRDARGQPFEAAVDAIIAGDLDTLANLLRDQPELVKARSDRTHRAMLLHYVAANGVENYRQITPPNAVAVARLLLEAGAEVDALAETYGGGKAQTTLNLLVSSVHPAAAGLQVPLARTLLDFGAATEGLEDNGSPLWTALAFGYGPAAEALSERGARVDHIISAAALGRVDLVKEFLDGSRVPAPTPKGMYWLRLPDDPQKQAEMALAWACKFKREAAVQMLLERGVNPAGKDSDDMTALHWAAANGLLDVLQWLLARGAPLEALNRWGGTVLSSTLHFALYQPIEGANYPAVIETLLAAGADASIAGPFPTGVATIDEVLERHGVKRQ